MSGRSEALVQSYGHLEQLTSDRIRERLREAERERLADSTRATHAVPARQQPVLCRTLGLVTRWVLATLGYDRVPTPSATVTSKASSAASSSVAD